jgi:hypothetical protein
MTLSFAIGFPMLAWPASGVVADNSRERRLQKLGEPIGGAGPVLVPAAFDPMYKAVRPIRLPGIERRTMKVR